MTRYKVGTGGEDEPGLLLILDCKAGIVVARSSSIAEKHVQEFVDLANASASARPEAQETGWQPIETAPKDGVLLLWFEPTGGWSTGLWRGSWSYVANQWVIHIPASVDGKSVLVFDVGSPTHWMPLPVAPV